MRCAMLLLIAGTANADAGIPWVVLPESLGPEMMRQCSRNTPDHIQRFWTPGNADIVIMEDRLKAYEKYHHVELQLQLARSHRQYVGFIKGGRRFIYGNFYPASGHAPLDETKTVVDICDGGPGLWGVVYSVDDGVFSDFEHNGVA